MKAFKKILWTILGLMVAFFLFFRWYQHQYSMSVVMPYEVNSTLFEKNLLIATQGSDFKNAVTAGVMEHHELDSVYIKVIDVSGLGVIDSKDFDALLIIHTWENWKPPLSVKTFIDTHQYDKNKMVVLTTSGEGSYKMADVDAITGESIVADAPLFVDEIMGKLKPLLEK